MTHPASTAARTFERTVTIVIIVNSALLVWGLIDHGHNEIAEHAETGCLLFFTGELVVRFRREGWRFLTQPWSIADMAIIGLALLPLLGADTSLLRLARLARAGHLLKHITVLRLWRVMRFPAASRRWLAAMLAAGVITAPVAHAGSTVPAPISPACNLPITRDLIVWTRWPGVQDFATKNGDVDLVHCIPTLDGWRDWEQTGPGYCSAIAWASDNPGYDVDARPAPRLKHVIDKLGDC